MRRHPCAVLFLSFFPFSRVALRHNLPGLLFAGRNNSPLLPRLSSLVFFYYYFLFSRKIYLVSVVHFFLFLHQYHALLTFLAMSLQLNPLTAFCNVAMKGGSTTPSTELLLLKTLFFFFGSSCRSLFIPGCSPRLSLRSSFIPLSCG